MLVTCIISYIDSGIFWTGFFEMPEVVEHAVDHSLERAVRLWRYVELEYFIFTRKICVSQICVCVGWSYIDETPVGTVILPQIGELPVHLSLGEVLL